MSKDDIKPRDLCPPQMYRLNPEYYYLIKDLLKSYENQHDINRRLYESRNICLHSQTSRELSNLKGPFIFSTKCECSDTCKGKLTYNCKITKSKKTNMFINLSGCESNLDYNIEGLYNYGFTDDVMVNYENGSKYYGKWKDGMPHGIGFLKLTGVKREYYKICQLDVKHIKLSCYFNEGLLDESKKFKLIVVLNNIKKKDKYRIIVYEDTTLYNKIFIPDKEATITYYNSNDENPEKCYGIFKGTINKTDRLNGVMRYSNIKALIIYYKGEFKHNQIFEGLCIFSKSHSLYSFEGKYDVTGPYFGTKKYRNGAIYIGYVNKYYQNHGEGQLDETKIHDVECECCKGVIIKYDYNSRLKKALFGLKTGCSINGKLVFEHPLTTKCSKPRCNNIKNVACLVCKEYYCDECYDKHQKMKGFKRYHDVMRLSNEKDLIKESKLEITPPTQINNIVCYSHHCPPSPPKPLSNHHRIETKPNTLGNYFQKEEKKTKNKKKRNKKKKKMNIQKEPSQYHNPYRIEQKELVITDEEKKDLESGIVNEKLMNFMSDVALQELKDRGIVNDTTREEDIKCSVKDMFSITSINNINPDDIKVINTQPQSILKDVKVEIEVDAEEVFEEEQPYDSSFEDFLKEMKKQYNSDLSRKQKSK